MRRKTFRVGITRCLVIALILALCLVPICSSPAAALSIDDYFEISYEPVEFSKTEVHGDEVFYATIKGTVTCIKKLPVDEVSVTSRVIATHQVSGAEVTLNSNYTVTIPVPSEIGVSAEIEKVVSLQFPAQSESGGYDVVGELIEALLGWLDVAPFLTPSQKIQTMGSVTYVSGSAGGGVGGGGGSGGLPGVTNVIDSVTESGRFTEDITAKSEDAKAKLTISKNTIGKKKGGQPLRTITIIEMEDPPAPPADSRVIGLVYDFSPDGTTFEPPVTLTFTYDPDDIPEGVTEENLVVAMWDEEADKWVVLEGGTVDPVTHAISAPVSHFTTFAVIAYTRPAAFTVSDLSITPAEVSIGGSVAISVLITNAGDLTGSHAVTLKINDTVVETRMAEVSGGNSEKVSFSIAEDTARTYTVNIDGLSGTFEVKAALVPIPVSPAPAPAPAPPAPAPAPAPSPSVPPVVPPVVPPKPINWWLVGGIAAGCIIIGVIISLVVRRRQV